MILNIEIFQRCIGGVQASLDVGTVTPFFNLAERNLKKLIGKELVAAAEANSDELRELVENYLSWNAYSMAFPHMKFRVGDLGLMKNSPNNSIAITKWEYVDSLSANLEMQDIYLEFIWLYLEENESEIEAWTDSKIYLERQKHLIRSAGELNTIVPLAGLNSRFFDKIQVYIKRAEELYIKPVLTEEDYDILLDRWRAADADPVFTKLEEKVIECMQQATAHLAVFEAYPYLPLKLDETGIRSVRKKDGIQEEELPDKRLTRNQRTQLYADGELYIGKLKKLIDKNASETVFPNYYLENKSRLTATFEDEDFSNSTHIIL